MAIEYVVLNRPTQILQVKERLKILETQHQSLELDRLAPNSNPTGATVVVDPEQVQSLEKQIKDLQELIKKLEES